MTDGKPEAMLAKTRRAVENELVKIFDKRISEAAEIDARYADLWGVIKSTALGGGKYIRPYLVMIGYGEYSRQLLPVAVAHELIHVAMLVHDDVIDQDFYRYGQPNVSGRHRELYKKRLSQESAVHYAESVSILAGDVLIAEAYRQLNLADLGSDVKQKLIERFSRSIYDAVGGELLDVEAAIGLAEIDPLKIARYKTASYSFTGPLVSGAICAGASDDRLELLEKVAINLGITYQLQDDLLGTFGDERQTGKSAYSDLREGKKTLLIHHHEQLMNESQRQNFAAFGKASASTTQLDKIRLDIDESGARQQTYEMVDEYLSKAEKLISKMPEDSTSSGLIFLIDKLKYRAS